MSALVWYRNDLREAWHRPLAAALAGSGPVRAVWFLCEAQWNEHGVAPVRRWYVLESVRELGRRLARRGVVLDVVDASDFSAVPSMLERHVVAHGITDLYVNREYPLNERRRDSGVARVMRDRGVVIHGFDDGVLVPPGELRTGQGGRYTVFTPWRRQWDRWLEAHPPAQPRLPAAAAAEEFDESPLDAALSRLQVDADLCDRWQPGEQVARARLDDFLQHEIDGYHRQRDLPALDGTSVLSAALSSGTLSVAECFSRASERSGAGAATWINELGWRDFYRHIACHFPAVSRGEPFRPETGYVQWRRDPELFRAWCEGRTGYPFVDAGMRQLNATGWMHNRMRMVTAMFLSKHLFLDWRWGEEYFMQHLIDGDFAANNGGWQWSASTGTDAVPWFRVFNPVRQGQRFDPGGDYIRRHVPELAHLPGKLVHEPWKEPGCAPAYPARIVPHEGVRARVGEAFGHAREIFQRGTGS